MMKPVAPLLFSLLRPDLTLGQRLGKLWYDTDVVQPHIFVVLIDDAGYADFGYNQRPFEAPISPTPTIDRLACDGLKISRFYVQPTCSPSRAALLTGNYAWRNGLSDRGVIGTGDRDCLGNLTSGPLEDHLTLGNPKNKLLPELLADVGYRSHQVGKWNLGNSRTNCYCENRGFESCFGPQAPANDHFAYTVCQQGNARDEGFPCNRPADENNPDGYDLRDTREESGVLLIGEFSEDTYSSNLYAKRTVEIIEDHDPNEPLFVYLTPTAPHSPLQAVPEDLNSEACKDLTNDGEKWICAMMRSLDRMFSSIETTLKNKKMWDNTIIWFMSDNGGLPSFGSSNGDLAGQKSEYLEGGIRVGAAISGGRVEGKFKYNRLTKRSYMDLVDVAPTLLGAAGADSVMFPFDGRDLSETLKLKCYRDDKCDPQSSAKSKDDDYMFITSNIKQDDHSKDKYSDDDYDDDYDDDKHDYEIGWVDIKPTELILRTISDVVNSGRNWNFTTGGLISPESEDGKYESVYKYFITPQRTFDGTPTTGDTAYLYDLLADPGERDNLIDVLTKVAKRMRRRLEEVTENEAPNLKTAIGQPRLGPSVGKCWLAEDDPAYNDASIVNCTDQIIPRTRGENERDYGLQCLGEELIAYNPMIGFEVDCTASA